MKVSSLLPMGMSISCITGCGPSSSKAIESPQSFDIEPSTGMASTSAVGLTADVQSADNLESTVHIEPTVDIESVTEETESFYESSDEDESTGGLSQPTGGLPDVLDDPTSPKYLWNHGYYHIIGDTGAIQFYTDRFAMGNQKVVLRILADRNQKFTKVYENYLEYQKPHELNLDIEEIYHGLCHEYRTDYKEMNWISMEVGDKFWRDTIGIYREDNRIDPSEEIKVTPEHPDWDLFTSNRYYIDAIRMVPKTEVLEITVNTETRREFKDRRNWVVADVITFWFKKPQSIEEDNAAIDPPSQDTAESSSSSSSSNSKPATDKPGPRRKTLQALFDETKDEHRETAGNAENDDNDKNAAQGENDAKLEDEDNKALDEDVARYVWGSLWDSVTFPSNRKTDNTASTSGPSGSGSDPEIVPVSS